MHRGLLIGMYIFATVIVLGYLVDAQNVRRCYDIGFPSYLFIEIKDGEYIVRNEDEYLLEHESDASFSGLNLYARPKRTQGPLKNGFTFYYSRSFMTSQSDVRMYDWGEHTEEELGRMYEAALAYAKAHPVYAPYHPGEPATITFDSAQMIKCGAGVASYFGLPLLIAWFGALFQKYEQQKSWAYRRKHMQCVHCTYSIEGLGSHICPECGQLHGSSIEATA